MKKLFVIAAMAICSLGANAQVWIGGGLDFECKDFDASDDNQISYSINPEIGYSLDEKWDVAIALGFGGVNNEGGKKDANYTKFSIKPYVRYTFAQVDKVGFFVDGCVDFTSKKPKDVDAVTTFGIGLRPGVKFAVADNLTLAAHFGGLGYETQKDSYSRFGFKLNNGVALSMYWSL